MINSLIFLSVIYNQPYHSAHIYNSVSAAGVLLYFRLCNRGAEVSGETYIYLLCPLYSNISLSWDLDQDVPVLQRKGGIWCEGMRKEKNLLSSLSITAEALHESIVCRFVSCEKARDFGKDYR